MLLKNFWANATNVTASLASPDPNITITPSQVSYGNILNGETKTGTFQIQVGTSVAPGEYAFNMHVESGSYSKDFTFYLNIYNKISSGFPVNLTEEIHGKYHPKIADLSRHIKVICHILC